MDIILGSGLIFLPEYLEILQKGVVVFFRSLSNVIACGNSRL